MLVLTILFISYYVSSILKINWFQISLREIGQNAIKLVEINNAESAGIVKDIFIEHERAELNKQFAKKILWVVIFALILAIFEVIYFVNALPMDIYKYPTIFAIIVFILQVFNSKKNNNKLETPEQIEEYKQLLKKDEKINLTTIFFLVYFLYMLYILVSIKGL